MATFAGYPWGTTVRNMAELYPKINGANPWQNNYRKASVWLWYYPFIGNYYVGFGSYCAKNFPTMFIGLWLADSYGLFVNHSVDPFTMRGGGSFEDSYA
jgi:hypothetical protein